MAQWRKVVVSGSTAELNNISASGDIVPITTDGSSLGSSTHNFSDLFLDSGAVVNFDSGDMTLTHAANEVQVNGGDLVVESTNKVGFGGAPSTDYIQKDTDVKVVAAADIILDPDGGQVSPASDDDAGLGEAGTAWSDLFLAEGGVINWDSGDVTLTQTADQLALAGGYLTVAGSITGSHFSGSAASTGSFGYLNVFGDAVIAGNLTFGDADTDTVSFGADITSNILPDASDTYNLGSDSQRWNDLYLSGSISASGGHFDFKTDVDSAAAFTVITDAGTSEKIVFTNTQGTGNASIDLTATAGGITAKVADGKDLTLGNAESDAYFKVAARATAGSEDVRIVNTNGTDEAAIAITSTAGGVDIDAAAGKNVDIAGGQVLVASKTDEANAIKLLTNQGTSETIVVTNTQGTDAAAIDINATAGGIDVDAAGAISLDSSAGSIDINVVDGQTVAIGLNGGVETLWKPHGTAGSELWSTINTDGTTDGTDAAGAILLSAVAGGIGLAWADDKDLWAEGGQFVVTANHDTSGAIKLHADAGSSQSIIILNDAGTNAAAIDIQATAGGIDIDAGSSVTIDGATSLSVIGSGSATFGDDTEHLVYDGSGNVDFDSVVLDIDASAGLTMTSTTMAFDPTDTFDLDAAGAITIDGASITLGGDADTAFDIDTSTLDIDSSGAVTIDGATSLSVIGSGSATFGDDTEHLVYDGSGNVDFDTVGLDIDSSGAITIDGTSSLSIDVDAASNFNTSAGDITIDSEAGSVNIDGGESAANAIKIVASDGAGGIDIDAGSAGINVDSTGGITVGGTNATGVTLGKSDTTVTVAGSLDVNGTVTTIDSANTYIADKFMIIASGSTSDTDGGILIQNAAGAGYGLGYDSGIDRWVFDADLAHTATDIVPDAYVGVIQTGTTHGDSVAVPTYGGTTNGVGTIYIDTDAGDQGIWIYS